MGKEIGNIVLEALGTIVDLAFIGLLWMVTSLGIVTLGASSTAAYYCMVKCVRRKSGYIHKEFFRCFRDNFKQSLGITGIFYAILLVVAVDLYFIYCNFTIVTMSMGVVILAFTAYALEVFMFACPILSRFDNKVGHTVKVSAALAMRYIHISLLFLILFALMVIGILAMPFLIIILPGVYMFVKTYPMEWVMRKFMPRVAPDSEEAEEWYNKR